MGNQKHPPESTLSNRITYTNPRGRQIMTILEVLAQRVGTQNLIRSFPVEL